VREEDLSVLGADVPYWPQYERRHGYYLTLKYGMNNASVGSHYQRERTSVLEGMYLDLQSTASGTHSGCTSSNVMSMLAMVIMTLVVWL